MRFGPLFHFQFMVASSCPRMMILNTSPTNSRTNTIPEINFFIFVPAVPFFRNLHLPHHKPRHCLTYRLLRANHRNRNGCMSYHCSIRFYHNPGTGLKVKMFSLVYQIQSDASAYQAQGFRKTGVSLSISFLLNVLFS
jgi:hypothetical protein